MSRQNPNRNKMIKKVNVASDDWDDDEEEEEEDPFKDSEDEDKSYDPKTDPDNIQKSPSILLTEENICQQNAKKSNKDLQRMKKKLAAAVLREEVIHNHKHKLHTNVNAKHDAWTRVAVQMNKSGIYKKWNNFI